MKYLSIFFLFVASNLFADSSLYPIVVDNKVGYIDSTGKIVFEPKFNTPVTYFKTEIFGRTIYDFDLPDWAYFSEGKATVQIDKYILYIIKVSEAFAVINTQGKYTIAPGEYPIGQFCDSIAYFKNLDKTFEFTYDYRYGFLNTNADVVIKDKYKYVSNFSNGTALVLEKGKYGIIDKSGTYIINNNYEELSNISEGFAVFAENNKYGYIKKDGSVAVIPSFDKAWSFSNGLGRILTDHLYGFVKKDAKLLSLPMYDFASNFSEGLAAVKNKDKFGYINTEEKTIIGFEYDDAGDFSEGLALVAKDGKYGFINHANQFELPAIYSFAKPFVNGVAKVWLDGNLIYINKKGEEIFRFYNEDEIEDFLP